MAAFDHLAVNTELVEGPSQSNLRPAVHFLGGNRRHSIITSCVSGGVGQLRFFAAKGAAIGSGGGDHEGADIRDDGDKAARVACRDNNDAMADSGTIKHQLEVDRG